MKISVITVCLNAEKYLERAVKSVISQTHNDVEYIIVDGGSRDSTLQIINKYKTYFNSVTSEHDQGIYDAMNKGIRQSSGDIIYLLNSDDRLYSSETLSLVNSAFLGKDADLVYGNIMIQPSDDAKLIRGDYPDFISKLYLMRRTIAHQATFFRRDCFEKIGYFDTRYKILADYDWLLRAVLKKRLKYLHLRYPVSVFQNGGVSTNLEFEKLKMAEYANVKQRYFSHWDLKTARLFDFFVYGDIFRIVGRHFLGGRRYNSLKAALFKKAGNR